MINLAHSPSKSPWVTNTSKLTMALLITTRTPTLLGYFFGNEVKTFRYAGLFFVKSLDLYVAAMVWVEVRALTWEVFLETLLHTSD